MKRYINTIDKASLIVMGVTLILFLLALFTKGLTHDILLEAGVFLVSVKLIISTYKITVSTKKIQDTVTETLELLKSHANEENQKKE